MNARGWFPLLLLGCGGIEEQGDYELARAEAECRQLERCELGYFESEFRDMEDCVDDREDRFHDADNELDDADCIYDPDQAAFCVDRIEAMGCEDWARSGNGNKACDLVWDCREEQR